VAQRSGSWRCVLRARACVLVQPGERCLSLCARTAAEAAASALGARRSHFFRARARPLPHTLPPLVLLAPPSAHVSTRRRCAPALPAAAAARTRPRAAHVQRKRARGRRRTRAHTHAVVSSVRICKHELAASRPRPVRRRRRGRVLVGRGRGGAVVAAAAVARCAARCAQQTRHFTACVALAACRVVSFALTLLPHAGGSPALRGPGGDSEARWVRLPRHTTHRHTHTLSRCNPSPHTSFPALTHTPRHAPRRRRRPTWLRSAPPWRR
jgi:hypothetical protein